MIEPRIKGAEQLGELAARLKAAGDQGKGLKRELSASLQRATKPLKIKAQKAAGDTLPQSGGLAGIVSKSKISTRTRSGKDPGVSITVRGTAMSTDRGFVRHKVFGRPPWVSQSVQGGWFTETMKASAPEVRKELNEAIEAVADKIEG